MKVQLTTAVLVAEDDSRQRDFFVGILRHLGFTHIDHAPNGQRALALFREHEYGLVFLDIEMPNLNGIEALHHMFEHRPETNIVMVSAHSTVDNVKTAIKEGAKGFIVKPYSIAKVEGVLKKVLGV
ncbi:MAG: response regulator [Chromatiales bacterium]|nr:response regulator [Chromatiales bacterium]